MDVKYENLPAAERAIVYVRPVLVSDLPSDLQEQAEGIQTLYAVHRPNGERVALVADRKLELPKPDQPSDFFWLTDDAEPTRQHPRQHSLDLRDAADERGGLRTPIKALADTFTQPDADGVIQLKEAK